MPEVAVAERMLFGAFGVGESRCRPLGLWSKALPSCADNYSLFEKHLLACYWALVETECKRGPPRYHET